MKDLLDLAFDRPESAIQQAEHILATTVDPLERSYAFQATGIVHREAGRTDRAISVLRSGMTEARRSGSRGTRIETYERRSAEHWSWRAEPEQGIGGARACSGWRAGSRCGYPRECAWVYVSLWLVGLPRGLPVLRTAISGILDDRINPSWHARTRMQHSDTPTAGLGNAERAADEIRGEQFTVFREASASLKSIGRSRKSWPRYRSLAGRAGRWDRLLLRSSRPAITPSDSTARFELACAYRMRTLSDGEWQMRRLPC